MNAADRGGSADPEPFERILVSALLENIPDSIYFKDTSSRFVVVSRAKAVRHDCSDPAGLIGKTDADIYSAPHARRARIDEEKIMADGVPIVGQIEQLSFSDGRERWARTTKLPLRDADGRIVGTFGLSQDVTAAHQLKVSLEQTNRDLVDASHLAGMAEVATGVLHNVGNVLNSLNVSAAVISGRLRQSNLESLARVAELLQRHRGDSGRFLAEDAKGRLIPDFVHSLAQHLAEEQALLAAETQSLQRDIDHIKDIVAMQQSYATLAGVVETLAPADLMEDSLRMNAAALSRHDVTVVRDFQPVPRVRVERGKVLQILINLIRNAKYAIDTAPAGTNRAITLRLAPGAPGMVRFTIADQGVGISPENLASLFVRGFTTRVDGHGFGLHSSALAAEDMGGTLTGVSGGTNQGATFCLELPVAEPAPT